MNANQNGPTYDVAVSFAGEDRYYVGRVVDALKRHGVSVFYDEDERSRLWGTNLLEELESAYRDRAFRTLMFISATYVSKAFPTHERRAAMSRFLEDPNTPHILPVRLDDTDVPGLHTSTGYLDGRQLDPEEIAVATLEHLAAYGRELQSPPEELRRREEMARRVSARADVSQREDGRWNVKYRVHNGGENPLHAVVLVIDDTSLEGAAEDQQGTALELVIGTMSAGEVMEDVFEEMHMSREPAFGDGTRQTL